MKSRRSPKPRRASPARATSKSPLPHAAHVARGFPSRASVWTTLLLGSILLSIGSSRTLRTFYISFRLRFSAPYPTPSCFTLQLYHRALPHTTLPFLLRILRNDSANFFHFGHNCSSSTSLCGSVATSTSFAIALFSSLPAYRRILVFIARLSYKSFLAWPRQRQMSAAHFLPLALCFTSFCSRAIDWRRPEPAVPSIVFLVSCFFVIFFNILVHLS